MCKAVYAAEAKEAGETEVGGAINPSIKNTGKTRNVSIVKGRDIHPRFYQR